MEGAVRVEGGSYTGERGLARRGLESGERCEELRREGEAGCGAAPWSVWAERGPMAVVVRLGLREKLEWWAWPFSRGCEERLLVVLWDQRFMLAAPSRKAPMPSAAPLAALERRLAEGGGVGRVMWGLDVDVAVDVDEASGLASLSEAALFTVTTDDDETDVLRDEVRRCCGRMVSCCCSGGGAAGLLCIFMLAGEPAMGVVSQN